jgi:hypothetical protein
MNGDIDWSKLPPLPPLGATAPAVGAVPREAAAGAAPKKKNRTAKSGGKSTGNDFYLTPADFLDVVRLMGPIELDPAGSEKGSFVNAEREYRLDRGEDGLVLSWRLRSIDALSFCNPPYSKGRAWIEKADAEFEQHESESLLLIAARTETVAVQASKACFICFVKGRLTFCDPITKAPPKDAKGKDTAAMFPSMVLYYGQREARFRAVFEPLGKVVRWT